MKAELIKTLQLHYPIRILLHLVYTKTTKTQRKGSSFNHYMAIGPNMFTSNLPASATKNSWLVAISVETVCMAKYTPSKK